MTIDTNLSKYTNFNKENDEEDRKFEILNHVRISKYKNIFEKIYFPNWSEEDFMIKMVKTTVPWTYIIGDLNGEENFGMLYEKELKKLS